MHTSHVRETLTCTQYALRWNYETVHVLTELTKKASCLEKVTRRPLSCQGAPRNVRPGVAEPDCEPVEG